jgi:hypothetical protein
MEYPYIPKRKLGTQPRSLRSGSSKIPNSPNSTRAPTVSACIGTVDVNYDWCRSSRNASDSKFNCFFSVDYARVAWETQSCVENSRVAWEMQELRGKRTVAWEMQELRGKCTVAWGNAKMARSERPVRKANTRRTQLPKPSADSTTASPSILRRTSISTSACRQ